MIEIKKGSEPVEWMEIKKTPGITYDTADKTKLRKSLYNEQGGLCAYCMRKIHIVEDKQSTTRIEHIKPRAISIAEGCIEETLQYNNMVLCCDGDIDGDGNYHCDRSKEDNKISFNLFNNIVFDTISYSSKDGQIMSSNAVYNKEFNGILNLNHPRLMKNRLAVIKALITELGKKQWKKKELKDKLDCYANKTSDGTFREYCGVTIWFLKKMLRKYQK